MFFSIKDQSFCDPRINIKSDGDIDVSSAEYVHFVSERSRGCNIVIVDGKLTIIEPSVAPKALILEHAKTELRTMRAPMLDALTGIAGRAVRAGNNALAAEADSLAEQLLDVTDDQELNDATTYEEMQAAGVAAYKRIAATASAELSTVFSEITGA